jgi:hypothetical protein
MPPPLSRLIAALLRVIEYWNVAALCLLLDPLVVLAGDLAQELSADGV